MTSWLPLVSSPDRVIIIQGLGEGWGKGGGRGVSVCVCVFVCLGGGGGVNQAVMYNVNSLP